MLDLDLARRMTNAGSRSSVLALNSGSSSLKFGLYRNEASIGKVLLLSEAESIGGRGDKFWAKDASRNVLGFRMDELRDSQADLQIAVDVCKLARISPTDSTDRQMVIEQQSCRSGRLAWPMESRTEHLAFARRSGTMMANERQQQSSVAQDTEERFQSAFAGVSTRCTHAFAVFTLNVTNHAGLLLRYHL